MVVDEIEAPTLSKAVVRDDFLKVPMLWFFFATGVTERDPPGMY